MSSHGRSYDRQLTPNAGIRNRPILRAEVTVSRLEEVRAAGASTVTVSGTILLLTAAALGWDGMGRRRCRR